MDIDALKQDLLRDEALRTYAYQDSEGYLTIGVGRNIDRRGGKGLTPTECLYLLDNDVKDVIAQLDAAFPWWKQLDPVRQSVLANMCFNLGLSRLRQFKGFLGALQAGNYAAAAAEMEDSLWYKQVGARAARLVDKMKGN
jgi:lysozyme